MISVLSFSKEEAARLRNYSVTPTHILLAILRHKDNKARELLFQIHPDLLMLKKTLEETAKQSQMMMAPSCSDLNFDTQASRIIRLGVLEATLMKSDFIDTIHVLMALLKAGESDASSLLEQMDVTYEKLANITHPQWTGMKDNDDEEEDDDDEEEIEEDFTITTEPKEAEAPVAVQPRKKISSKTPVLDNFGVDLTVRAEEGLLDPMVGRDKEIERVAQILSRRKKNNPILIGQPGVGKSAIVEGLATCIVQRRISRALWDKRVIMLDMASVVAGTKYRGQFEERIRSIVNELQKNPDIIVFIDEIHTIVGAGSAPGSMDAANMLKPALSRGEFQCIGATTIDEYRKTIEKDGALERRFQKVLVEPTTADETLCILEKLKKRYEDHHHVQYTQEALMACVKLTERYVTDRCFPDKAIDAMDEAGSRVHIQERPIPAEIQELEKQISELQNKKNEAAQKQNFEYAADYRDQILALQTRMEEECKKWKDSMDASDEKVDEVVVADVVSMMTGIPVQRIGQEESVRLRGLENTLQRRVIGQNQAVGTLVRAIKRSRVGLRDPRKPIGTFLFVGPTGVGKTYLTKCLAEELFGSADAIIRIDMSEYMEKHTVSRMVGAPPGYVGYDEGGQLTEQVRRKPYSIVLLDEIEKAHTDVFNVLLQVMDEGRLTDGNGSTIDFKNTVIIMTSNCGTKQVREFAYDMGFQVASDAERSKQQSHDIITKALRKQFAPEFLNRVDNVIYFDQLAKDDIRSILDIELTPLLRRLKALGTDLFISDDAKDLLIKEGYDTKLGARPLKRAIQDMLEDPLCEVLMSEHVPAQLFAVVEEGKIVIS